MELLRSWWTKVENHFVLLSLATCQLQVEMWRMRRSYRLSTDSVDPVLDMLNFLLGDLKEAKILVPNVLKSGSVYTSEESDAALEAGAQVDVAKETLGDLVRYVRIQLYNLSPDACRWSGGMRSAFKNAIVDELSLRFAAVNDDFDEIHKSLFYAVSLRQEYIDEVASETGHSDASHSHAGVEPVDS